MRKRGRAGQNQRQRRLARTNGLCERCLGEGRWKGKGLGRVTLATVVNHIIPLAHGGSDEDENTENLCGGPGSCDEYVTAQQFDHQHQARLGACDASGMPTDPDHPWNRSA